MGIARRIALACVLVVAACDALAGQLLVGVADDKGTPVADAVVTLRPVGLPSPAKDKPLRHVVDQRGLAFMPYLQVFRPGDEVVFRNSDATRHHVYSFSPARAFEFVLGPGQSSSPLKLDKVGSIAVGCNIHDQMIAHLYVTDAPWFVQTGANGRAQFDALPAGDYEVRVWQPRLRPGKPEQRQVVRVGKAGQATLSVPLRLLPDPRLQVGREHVHY
ncbi:MAG TPA: carboxypeptidase regulatory-like domain-containing protein [Thermomonas sp.]|nr:carboxypeptidase regulatory-like domain-containing protein [Thermomonas sp.]